MIAIDFTKEELADISEAIENPEIPERFKRKLLVTIQVPTLALVNEPPEDGQPLRVRGRLF